MKAKYVGETEDGVSAFGKKFEPGKVVEIDDKHAKKIAGNPHFEAVDGSVKADKPKANQTGDDEFGLEAVHRGRGSYSIMDGDKEVKAGLSKDEAEAFNALSDDDKAAHVADQK